MRRLERKTLLAAAITAAAMLAARPSAAISPGPFSSLTQPANALLMPFAATEGSSTWLQVSNVSGVSPVPGSSDIVLDVATHWVFWRENGTHLAEVFACLTLGGTIEMNTTAIQGVDRDGLPVGPRLDLSGQRGFAVVTAYAADSDCAVRSDAPALIDDAIVGSYAIREGNLRYGGNALGFGVDPTGSFTDLPDLSLEEAWPSLSISTMNPSEVSRSRVILMAVEEKRGSGAYRRWEIGPPSGVVSAGVWMYEGGRAWTTSLPDVRFLGALFTTVKPGETGSLLPGTVVIDDPGVFHLWDASPGEPPLGSDTFVWAIHAQAKGKRRMTVNAVY